LDRKVRRFVLWFLVDIIALSIVLQTPLVDSTVMRPFTAIVAQASGWLLNLTGAATQVAGTTIVGRQGFSVEIVNGCNGVYVMGIVVAAVLAFPCSARQKAIGIALCCVGVQIANGIRIVSLYWIGLKWPAAFQEFHVYIWQVGVIVVSMAIWVFWAEATVVKRSPAGAFRRT